MRTEEVRTSLGPAMDLSISGVRIRCGLFGPRPGKSLLFTIHGPEEDFAVCGRVAWSRRAGLLTREIGVEFGALSEEALRQLSLLARQGFGHASPRNHVHSVHITGPQPENP